MIVACVAAWLSCVSVGDSRLCSSMVIVWDGGDSHMCSSNGYRVSVWVIVACVAVWLSGVKGWVGVLLACVAAWLTLSLSHDFYRVVLTELTS